MGIPRRWLLASQKKYTNNLSNVHCAALDWKKFILVGHENKTHFQLDLLLVQNFRTNFRTSGASEISWKMSLTFMCTFFFGVYVGWMWQFFLSFAVRQKDGNNDNRN